MGAGTSTALMGVGTILNYQAQKAQAKAEEQADIFNAKENERYAQDVLIQAGKEEKRLRSSFKRDEATNVTSIASSGIKMSGSALDVLRDNARSMEADADRIQDQAQREASAARRGASQMRRRASSSKRAGEISSAAALLTGGSQTIGTAYDTGLI